MERIIIQEQITITQEDVDNVIIHYESLPDTYGMGIDGKLLNKKGIIKEIIRLSDIGKQILLMRYKFNKWQKSLSNRSSGKSQDENRR